MHVLTGLCRHPVILQFVLLEKTQLLSVGLIGITVAFVNQHEYVVLVLHLFMKLL